MLFCCGQNKKNRLFMVPHLERAHQGVQICAFHHTQTHEDTHMHDCTHVCIPPHAHACTCTRTHYKYLHYWWWVGKKRNDKSASRTEVVGFRFWLEGNEVECLTEFSSYIYIYINKIIFTSRYCSLQCLSFYCRGLRNPRYYRSCSHT